MTEYYLWLLQFMGAANPRSVQLIKRFGSAGEVYRAYTENPERFAKLANAQNSASLEESKNILDLCERHGYRVITLEQPDYPPALKNIYNPPVVLFVAGELSLDELTIAVVGTREACEYSFRATKRLCMSLVKAGAVIISGMAIGIDKTAHTAAVENGGKTIGVLACGFAVDYPKHSTPFRQEILNQGGAIVTELLPDSRGERGYFNQRNRIISGLSRGVLLVEAAEKSGCHITAAHAVSQNRDLFCIPPADIFNERFSGVVGYLRDGAIPVFSHDDILNEYRITPVYENVTGGLPAEAVPMADNTPVKSFTAIPEKPPAVDLSELSPEAAQVAELLRDGVKTVDFIAGETGRTADELSDLLLEMELDGVIESAAGSGYRLCL